MTLSTRPRVHNEGSRVEVLGMSVEVITRFSGIGPFEEGVDVKFVDEVKYRTELPEELIQAEQLMDVDENEDSSNDLEYWRQWVFAVYIFGNGSRSRAVIQESTAAPLHSHLNANFEPLCEKQEGENTLETFDLESARYVVVLGRRQDESRARSYAYIYSVQNQ